MAKVGPNYTTTISTDAQNETSVTVNIVSIPSKIEILFRFAIILRFIHSRAVITPGMIRRKRRFWPFATNGLFSHLFRNHQIFTSFIQST